LIGTQSAHLDVDSVEVEAGLREISHLLAEELVVLEFVMMVGSMSGHSEIGSVEQEYPRLF